MPILTKTRKINASASKVKFTAKPYALMGGFVKGILPDYLLDKFSSTCYADLALIENRLTSGLGELK